MKEIIDIDGEKVEICCDAGGWFVRADGEKYDDSGSKWGAIILFRQHKLAKLKDEIADAAITWESFGAASVGDTYDALVDKVEQYNTLKAKTEENSND